MSQAFTNFGAQEGYPVTPGDTDADNFFFGTSKAIYVGGAGDIMAIQNGKVVPYYNVPVGTILPIFATRINATDTTATLMTAMYG